MAKAPVKRFFGALLFIVGFFLTAGFLFLLFADAENITSVPLVADDIPDTAKVVGIALGVIALILAIMVIARAGRNRAEDDEDMFFIPEKDRVQLAYSYREPTQDEGPEDDEFEVYNLPNVKRQEHAWDRPEQRNRVFPYYFPRSVQDALYANDYITIDHEGRKIKLRTLIAGPKGAQRADLPRVSKRHLPFLKKQEEEKRMEEEAARISANSPPGDGEEFMGALENRSSAPREDAAPVDSDTVYYGYGGDNPAIDRVEALGDDAINALREAGIETAARLLYEDPRNLARATGYDAADIEMWQAVTELSKVQGIGPANAVALASAGVKGISDLKRRSADAIADAVAEVGGRVTSKRVEGWQEAARDLRRTKQRVPAA